MAALARLSVFHLRGLDSLRFGSHRWAHLISCSFYGLWQIVAVAGRPNVGAAEWLLGAFAAKSAQCQKILPAIRSIFTCYTAESIARTH
jgi:hypothetical protein